MEQNQHRLITGYLNRSLDKGELDKFYEWIHESADNRELYFEAKLIYDACTPLSLSASDLDESWRRLVGKREKLEKQESASGRRLWRRLAPYAAAVVILAVTVSGLFIALPKDDSSQFSLQYIGGNNQKANVLLFPDGTKICVGSDTRIHNEADYGKESRTVHLDGEAYFEVAKQADRPFIVKIKGQEIEVLGTKFNVRAYSSDSVSVTTLLEGSVQLHTEYPQKYTVLEPNQELVYNRRSNTIKVNEVDASLAIMWIDGYYRFFDQKLEIILSKLERRYDVRFAISSERLKNRKFSGTFYYSQDIEDILGIINLSIPIKWRMENKHITITTH
jgi:ferric-dicitrate binding protein FerR (iron transport regulator)